MRRVPTRRMGLSSVPSPLMRLALPILLAALLAGGCTFGRPPQAKEQEAIAWRTLGSWSGHGNIQTESFLIETGTLRVRWQTRNEQVQGAGIMRLVLQSSVSGRPLQMIVEQRGVGRGESFVAEGSRPAYMLVESADLDWSFTIEEGMVGTVKRSS